MVQVKQTLIIFRNLKGVMSVETPISKHAAHEHEATT